MAAKRSTPPAAAGSATGAGTERPRTRTPEPRPARTPAPVEEPEAPVAPPRQRPATGQRRPGAAPRPAAVFEESVSVEEVPLAPVEVVPEVPAPRERRAPRAPAPEPAVIPESAPGFVPAEQIEVVEEVIPVAEAPAKRRGAHKAPAAPAPVQPVQAVSRPAAAPVSVRTSGADVVLVRDLTKVYGTQTQVEALRGASLAIAAGQLTAIMGRSGSGKSTLLHCMAGLDVPTSGTVTISGEQISSANDSQAAKIRRDYVGYISRDANLFPDMTVADNIGLPLAIRKQAVDQAWYDQVIAILGLAECLGARPVQLPPALQQRVACARSMVAKPAVVFADEPTGDLDSLSAAEFLAMLRTLADTLGQSIVLATHDPVAASSAHRVFVMEDGLVTQEIASPNLTTVIDALRSVSSGYLA